MEEIVYSDSKELAAADLEGLFRSVGWLSADYPGRLEKAMRNSSTVFTAWQGSRLVGLVNALDDAELTAYIHYLLVDPAYQGRDIGQRLLAMIREKYKDYLYIILHSEDRPTVAFYEKQGFAVQAGAVPMEVLNLGHNTKGHTE